MSAAGHRPVARLSLTVRLPSDAVPPAPFFLRRSASAAALLLFGGGLSNKDTIHKKAINLKGFTGELFLDVLMSVGFHFRSAFISGLQKKT